MNDYKTDFEVYEEVKRRRGDLLTDLEEAVAINEAHKYKRDVMLSLSDVTDLINYTAKFRGVSRASLVGPSRKRELVESRQMIWWLMRNKVVRNNLSLAAIGTMFARDHATVIHGIKAVENEIEYNGGTRDELMMIANHFGKTTTWNQAKKHLIVHGGEYESHTEAMTTG